MVSFVALPVAQDHHPQPHHRIDRPTSGTVTGDGQRIDT